MSAARIALWRTAEAMSAGQGAALSPRARRFAARSLSPQSLDDLRQAPDWVGWGDAERTRLVRLTGAAASARRWRRTIDGEVLRQAADSIGEPALDALLALPDMLTPDLASEAAGDIEQLGGRLLLADAGVSAASAPRVRRLLNLSPSAAPFFDPAAASMARRAAEGVLAQLGSSTETEA